MKRFSLVRSLNFWSLLLSPALGVQAQTAAPTPPAMTAPYAAGGIFTDKGELGLESVRNEAVAQSSATPCYKSNGEETRFYEGYFKAASNNTKLALLSDDGTSVWIDDELILERANQDQGFNPSLANTFALLSKTFEAGRIYHIQLQYTNTIHTGDADVDGLTLWAYDGGGEMTNMVTSFVPVVAGRNYILSGAMDDEAHTLVLSAKIDQARAGVTVFFELIDNTPSTIAASLSVLRAATDASGIARVIVTSSNTPEDSQTIKVRAFVQPDKRDQKEVEIELLTTGTEFDAPTNLD